jgi:3-phosphoshikimate 1-carboxyvinyltransferase
MIDGLARLGIGVVADAAAREVFLHGGGGVISPQAIDLFVGNSGTTVRFLTALATLGNGTYRLDGIERMRQRPIADLVETLNRLGADVSTENKNGCPPVIVRGRGLEGGQAGIRGDVSSQFLSGLLMVAPYARNDVELVVEGPLVSRPYVRMTLRVMEAFGVPVAAGDLSRLRVAGGFRYQGRDYAIEPDASAASYFWGAAAVTGGRVVVEGLTRDALQGDVAFCGVLARMGCHVEYLSGGIAVTGGPLRGIEVDMGSISDTVQTLAAVALFAHGPTTIAGVAHIRRKETDRIGDLARELRRLGAEVEERADGLRILPGEIHGAEMTTYNDHRMAMSLALPGLRVPGVVIKDPKCTEKTYPDFFRDLAKLGANR